MQLSKILNYLKNLDKYIHYNIIRIIMITDLTISKNSKIPLYFQLEQLLKSKIITGEFTLGDQIPTEKVLCQTYNVSSITARQAILNLVNEGLLIRRRGRGTFVTGIQQINTMEVKGTINDLITDGKLQRVKVLGIGKIKTTKRVAQILRMKEGEEIIQVRRTRNVNGSAVSYIKNYIPSEIGEKIRKGDLYRYPMLQILREKFNIPLKDGIQYIGAIVADYEIASALAVGISSPILYIETIVFKERKQPVEFVQTFVRPDRYKYVVNLSMRQGPKKAVPITQKW